MKVAPVTMALALVLLFASCTRGDEGEASRPGAGDTSTAGARADSAATDPMAGMDHSAMPRTDAARPDSNGGAMKGMDHSTMPGMASARPDSNGGAMKGMDHSTMPGMASARPKSKGTAMKGMDHSTMPGMGAAPAGSGARGTSRPMAAMDHANMPGMGATQPARSPAGTARASTMRAMDHSSMPMGTDTSVRGSAMPGMAGMAGDARTPDEGSLKLQRLLAGLVEDPAVRQRILADSVLRKGWQNAAVRQSLRVPR